MNTRMAIKSLGLWSIFKVSLAGYYLFFLVQMIFLALIFLLIGLSGGALVSQLSSQASATGVDFAELAGALGGSLLVTFLIIFVSGLFAGPVYGLFCVIGALIYNLIGWMTGGVELGLVQKSGS